MRARGNNFGGLPYQPRPGAGVMTDVWTMYNMLQGSFEYEYGFFAGRVLV